MGFVPSKLNHKHLIRKSRRLYLQPDERSRRSKVSVGEDANHSYKFSWKLIFPEMSGSFQKYSQKPEVLTSIIFVRIRLGAVLQTSSFLERNA